MPILDAAGTVGHLGAKGAMVLRVEGTSHCLRIFGLTLPARPENPAREAADAPASPGIDFTIQRMRGAKDPCGPASVGEELHQGRGP